MLRKVMWRDATRRDATSFRELNNYLYMFLAIFLKPIFTKNYHNFYFCRRRGPGFHEMRNAESSNWWEKFPESFDKILKTVYFLN